MNLILINLSWIVLLIENITMPDNEEATHENYVPIEMPKEDFINKDPIIESKENVDPVKNNNIETQEIKPKINVDADSIIVNENVITDDEFFDDFFGDE